MIVIGILLLQVRQIFQGNYRLQALVIPSIHFSAALVVLCYVASGDYSREMVRDIKKNEFLPSKSIGEFEIAGISGGEPNI